MEDEFFICSAEQISYMNLKLKLHKQASDAIVSFGSHTTVKSFNVCEWLKRYIANNEGPVKTFIKDNDLYIHCRLRL